MRKLFFIFLFIETSASAQLNVDFSASVVQGCSPLVVQFKDLSSGGATSWFWDFGNGTTSYSQNPVITFPDAGSFSIRLIIKNSTAQNFKEKNNYITVFAKPEVNFYVALNDSGCAPLQPLFKDSSGLPATSIKSWAWNFGDGGTSSTQNPAHIYNTEGRYDVTLSVETNQGCTGTFTDINSIKVGTKPTASFSALPLNGCASVLRNFRNKSTGRITASIWDFGDGGTSRDKNPVYHYQDTGFFNVRLVVSDNGCTDTSMINNYIHVEGPVAKFNTSFDCIDRFTASFRNKSIAAGQYLWNFGDNQTSSDQTVNHTYSKPGIYVVKLAVTGTTCNDTAYDTLHIKTNNPAIILSPQKSTYCKFDSIQFTLNDYDTVIVKSLSWDFRDGSTTGFSKNKNFFTYAYNQNGSYAVQAITRDIYNCADTSTLLPPIKINGPVANFTIPANSCANLPVNIIDNSTAGSNIPINQFLWSYGDGTTSTDKTPIKYVYSFPGSYNVNLHLTDANGCIDTITHSIDIFQSPVVNAGNDTLICANTSLTLKPSGATSYLWQTNSDLSCINCENPVATPVKTVTYFVKGTSDGCSATDSVHIKVQTKEFIKATPTVPVCEGGSVQLNASGADNYTWSPSGTLNNSTVANPVASPSTNTVYTVTGKDSNNCFSDQAQVTVIIHPKPAVDIKDSILNVVIGSTVTILATADNNAQNFLWTPASGLSCFNCLQPSATVSNTTTYTLTAVSSFGCSDSDMITINVLCSDQSLYVPNTFSPNNDGMNDYFFPRSEGNPIIKSFTIFNRWGQLIFQKKDIRANNFNDGWNGRYKGEVQQSDVYIYIMELQCAGNRTFLKKGNVSLVR